MLPLSQRVAFSLFAVVCLVLGVRGFYRLYRRIRRGRADTDERFGKVAARTWYALRTTLTQERVFRKRPVLSVFHAFIFYAFVLYLLVNFVDALEGFVALPALRSPFGAALYGFLADSFSVLAIVGVLAFVVRRYLSGARRDFNFNARTLLHPAIKRGAIQRDSLVVSVFILLHVSSRVVGHAAEVAKHGPDRWQPFSSLLARPFVAHDPLAWRIAGYWGALGSVLLFLVYFPYSKHIHLFMAPVKYFFRREASSGTLPKMHLELDARESGPEEAQLGAAQLADLAWPRLLDAYACIQCNRCQDVCPASQTGKALSPAALEINKRMVLNEITREVNPFALSGAANFERGVDSGPKLLEAVISPESVWACTTCGACMEVCPTQDEQMLDILDIRRNLVMQEGEFPRELQTAFRGMERAGNPWAIARDKRMEWAESLPVPTIDEVPHPDVLYWVGCAASYDVSAQKTARAVVQLLTEAKVKFAVLGRRESCTGDSARRAGNELLYQELAKEAVATLHEARPKRVIASCPHCVNTIATEFPNFGGNFDVVHHTEFLASMVDEGRLSPVPASDSTVTFHDPCYLGRHRGTYEQPRSVLKVLTNDYVELERTKSNAFCCGAGGAQFWKEEERGTERISENRFREVQATLADARVEKVLAVGCPFCKSMLQSTPAAGEDASIVVKDVAELLWEGVQRGKGIAVSESAVGAKATAPALVATESVVVSPVLSAIEDPSTMGHEEQVAQETVAAVTAAPERKKWVPKAKGLPSMAPPQEAIAELKVVEAPASLPAEPAPAPESMGQAVAESAEATSEQNGAAPVRKKWQPKSKG